MSQILHRQTSLEFRPYENRAIPQRADLRQTLYNARRFLKYKKDHELKRGESNSKSDIQVEENPSQPDSRPDSLNQQRKRSSTELDKERDDFKLPEIKSDVPREVYGVSPQSALKPSEQMSHGGRSDEQQVLRLKSKNLAINNDYGWVLKKNKTTIREN